MSIYQKTQGDIVTCQGNSIFVWGINGKLLASRVSSSLRPVSEILCCTISEGAEWMRNASVVITGHRDGAVKVCRCSL